MRCLREFILSALNSGVFALLTRKPLQVSVPSGPSLERAGLSRLRGSLGNRSRNFDNEIDVIRQTWGDMIGLRPFSGKKLDDYLTNYRAV